MIASQTCWSVRSCHMLTEELSSTGDFFGTVEAQKEAALVFRKLLLERKKIEKSMERKKLNEVKPMH